MEENKQVYLTIRGVQYRVIATLGEGGQGTVYEAVSGDVDASRRFVIKKFHDNRDVVEFMESEKLAQTVAEYSHQAVFAAAFVDAERGASLMLKAPAGSRTFDEVIRNWEEHPPESPDLQYPDMGRLRCSLDMIKSTLGALAAWHDAGVLHLDISDKNVLWCEAKDRGVAYFLDMSSCRKIGYQHNGGAWSTNGYAAPELYGGGKLTPAADLYSVGALLFSLCGGGKHTLDEMLPELPGSLNGNVDALVEELAVYPGCKHLLREILIRATDRIDPHYETAEEMLTAIRHLEEVAAHCGVSRYTLLNGAVHYYNDQFSRRYARGVDPDLMAGLEKTPQGHTVILGEGGSGKTTLVYEVFRRKLDEAEQYTTAAIPLYVPLAGFDPVKENWSTYISDYILREYCGIWPDERNRTILDAVLKKGSHVIFLDGIDESVSSFLLGEQIEMLTRYPDVTVWIISRHGDFDWPCMELFDKVEILPLPGERIDEVLKKRGLSANEKLREVLANPMMLSLYDGSERGVLTAGEILLSFHQRLVDGYKLGYHSRKSQELYQTAILKILPKAANDLGKMHFSESDFMQCLGSNGTDGIGILDMLVAGGLIRKEEHWDGSRDVSYQFAHQIYLEWNMAQYVVQEMQRDCEGIPACLGTHCLADRVLEFVGELLGEYRADRFSRVEQWLQEHAAGISSDESRMAVRNLTEVMKRARSSRICADFRELDLTLTNFYQCNVTGSDFSEAILSDTTFIRSGHKKLINLVAILPEKNWLVTASKRENRIFLWDMMTGQMLRCIPCESLPLSLAVAPDERTILVHHGGTEITWVDLESNVQKKMKLLTPEGRRKLYQCGSVWDISFRFLDNESVLCNTGCEGEDQIVAWNLIHGTHKTVLIPRQVYEKYPEAETAAFGYAPEKHRLYCISSEGEVVTWNMRRGCPVGESFLLPAGDVDSMEVTPDGRWAAIWTGPRSSLYVMDLKTGRSEKIHGNLDGSGVALTQAVLTKETVTLGTDRGLKVWDFKKKIMQLHNAPALSALAMEQKQGTVAAADIFGKVRIGYLAEGRVTHSFCCGYEKVEADPVEVHWFDGGLVKKQSREHILTMSETGVKKLPLKRCFQSFLEGNYCVWLGVAEEGTDMLYVTDLRSGTVIAQAPWDPECIALDAEGTRVYADRSDLRWAKYDPDAEKIVICYSIGLVKSYDVSEKCWRELGQWAMEVQQILPGEQEGDAFKAMLLDIASRCHATQTGVLMGTCDGYVQFWDLDGNCRNFYKVHDRVSKLYPLDDTVFWVSEGTDGTRCVWNAHTMELADWSRWVAYSDVEEIGDLILYKEQFGDQLVLSELEATDWNCGKRVVNTAAQMLAVQNGDSAIYIYDLREKALCRVIDLSFLRPEWMFERLFFDCRIHFAFSKDGSWLAAGFPDGSVRICETKTDLQVDWKTTDTWDVSGAIFDGTRMSGELAKTLRQNGAIVKNLVDNSK